MQPTIPATTAIGPEAKKVTFNERFDPSALLAEFPVHLTPLEEFVRQRVEERKQLVS